MDLDKKKILAQKKHHKNEPKKWYENRVLIVRIQQVMLVLVVLLLVLFMVIRLKNRSQSASDSVDSPTTVAVTETNSQSEGENAIPPEADETVELSDNTMPYALTEPENPDGTGRAGIREVTPDRAEQGLEPGWHDTGLGSIWLALGDSLVYYSGWMEIDGNMYHFTEDGYAQRGWVLIGGQSCYFDDAGVYHPDQDNSKLLAFTFDDGPSHGMDELLDMCTELGTRVTFFMIGVQVENGGAVLPKIMRNRCEIGNHSYTHGNQYEKNLQETVDDFAKCDSFIRSFSGGPESTVVRFPYGNFTGEKTEGVGKPNIFWNIDSLDWELMDADKVYEQVMPRISEGDIILMHDRHETTVEACRRMFPELLAQGYQLVTVSELAAAKGYQLEPGMTYFSFCDTELESGRAFRKEMD